MYVVYIWKWSSAHTLGGVSGVAPFITSDEQLQLNRGYCFPVQAMLHESSPFHQFKYTGFLDVIILARGLAFIPLTVSLFLWESLDIIMYIYIRNIVIVNFYERYVSKFITSIVHVVIGYVLVLCVNFFNMLMSTSLNIYTELKSIKYCIIPFSQIIL